MSHKDEIRLIFLLLVLAFVLLLLAILGLLAKKCLPCLDKNLGLLENTALPLFSLNFILLWLIEFVVLLCFNSTIELLFDKFEFKIINEYKYSKKV